jgi:hypothetical protein
MAGKGIKKRKPDRKTAEGERREFLVHLDPRLIKILKLAALEAEMTASIVLEMALSEWLDRRMHRAKADEADDGGEKRQFLAKISVRVIKDVKLAAMYRHVTASSLVATGVTGWLARNKSRAQSPGQGH